MKNKKVKKRRKTRQFSKSLLIQESLLIWLITICSLVLAFICVIRGTYSDLPWISAMVGCPWAAYGVSQAFYYKKSMAENTKDGITFEMARQQNIQDIPEINIPEG